MPIKLRPSAQTRKNWLVDATLFIGGVIAALSGVYFLFLPSGGYQGGRNPMYGVTILFERHAWDNLHIWSGIAMLTAVAVHLVMHWHWVTMMSRRVVNSLRSKGSQMSRGARMNVALDALVAISFALTAISGVALLFVPSGGHASGTAVAWDLLHTWAGVVLISAAIVHLAIHWRWIKNVTRRLVLSYWPQPSWNKAPAKG